MSSQPPPAPMPWPKVPLRAVTSTASGTNVAQVLDLLEVARRGGGVEIPGDDLVGRTPAPAIAMRIAASGPSFDGVMMWSASELTPTESGSMPSGRKPSPVNVLEIADDPDRRAARRRGCRAAR